MNKITIALAKGRILHEALVLLKKINLFPVEPIENSRKLIINSNDKSVDFLVLRSADVPTYVEYGAADAGVVGKDVLLERASSKLYEMLDLNIAKCRLMTARPVNQLEPQGRIKVATKFANIAKSWYAKQGKQAEIIKLYGAMELAPLIGLSDVIVDVVDTGNTLRANGLQAEHLITQISSRLVVNQASMRTKQAQIQNLLDALETVIRQVPLNSVGERN